MRIYPQDSLKIEKKTIKNNKVIRSRKKAFWVHFLCFLDFFFKFQLCNVIFYSNLPVFLVSNRSSKRLVSKINFLLRTPTCLNPSNGSYMGYRPRPERVKKSSLSSSSSSPSNFNLDSNLLLQKIKQGHTKIDKP